jgi:hypothetical protein
MSLPRCIPVAMVTSLLVCIYVSRARRSRRSRTRNSENIRRRKKWKGRPLMSEIHVCCSILDRCKNLNDSYGEICVGCNACGRVSRKTMLEDRLAVYKEHLKEDVDKIGHPWYTWDTQKKNILSSIEYKVREIRKIQNQMRKRKDYDPWGGRNFGQE